MCHLACLVDCASDAILTLQSMENRTRNRVRQSKILASILAVLGQELASPLASFGHMYPLARLEKLAHCWAPLPLVVGWVES
mmetsp:Transcript_7883/g.18431  ORF Transcript_7883/g.18431 Transcript_7883/m.18431 type:complete len:82 (-) Transcript_7883:1083-1328(-)